MKFDLTTGIAIYGAVLSTLVFLWRILEFFHDRKTKLKVKIGKRLAQKSSNSIELDLFLSCFITNVGNIDTKIFAPKLLTDTKVSDNWNLEWHLIGERKEWPKDLKVNEIVIRNVPITLIDNEISERPVNKLRFQVKTTKGRIFYSDWISADKLFLSDDSMELFEFHPA